MSLSSITVNPHGMQSNEFDLCLTGSSVASSQRRISSQPRGSLASAWSQYSPVSTDWNGSLLSSASLLSVSVIEDCVVL